MITSRVSVSSAVSRYTGSGMIFICTINERKKTPSCVHLHAACRLPQKLIEKRGIEHLAIEPRLKYITLSSMLPARLIS